MQRGAIRVGMYLLIAATLSAYAQDPGKDVGVLLGLQGPSGLRTLWIQSHGSTLVISRELSGAVVPHGPTLCRLLLTKMNTDAGYDGREAIYTHSAISLDCGKGRPTGRPADAEGCEGGNTIDLLFLSSSHVSLDAHEGSACWGRTNSYDTLMVVPLKQLVGQWLFDPSVWGLPLASLGPVQRELKAPAIGACERYDPELQGMLLFELGLDKCSQVLPTQWGIRRKLGRWTIVGRTVGARTNSVEYDAPGSLPSAVYSWSETAVSTRAVLAEAKDAQDFITSPGGDFAVLLMPEVIQSAHIRDGRLTLGPPLGSKHPQEAIVSIEWATGTHVARWAALIDRMMAAETKRVQIRR